MMSSPPNSSPILIVEDDEEDRQLTRAALDESGSRGVAAVFVHDGRELMDYLLRRGAFAGDGVAPRPCMVLLDLNMPRMNGFEVLQAVRGHADFVSLPMIAFTTSRSPDDVRRSYDLGVNCYVAKPTSYEELVETLRVLKRFWLEIVSLPPRTGVP